MYFVCLFCIGFKCDVGKVPLCKSSHKVSNPVVSISTLEEENLQAQVYQLTKKIKDVFTKLFVAIFSSFREKNDREMLVLTLKNKIDLGKDKVNETKGICDVFDIIGDNCSYCNFELLETLITALGSDQDKSCLEKYNQAFGDYCKAMPCDRSESKSDPKKVRFKVDCSMEQLESKNQSIKIKIASHLGITPGELHLCCVKE